MFEIYDLFEGVELIAIVSSKKEAIKIKKERINETDGECYVIIKETYCE